MDAKTVETLALDLEAAASSKSTSTPTPNIDEQALRTRLQNNLLTIQEHRPELFRYLTTHRHPGKAQIIAGADGLPTCQFQASDQDPMICLSPHLKPQAALQQLLFQLKPTLAKTDALALLGLADGYLLTWLAHHIKPAALGMEQAVYIVEPDPLIMIYNMMLHDWTGERGPIRHQRFHWIIGSDWTIQLDRLWHAHPYLNFPAITVNLGPHAANIQSHLQRVQSSLEQHTHHLLREVHRQATMWMQTAGDHIFSPSHRSQLRCLLLTTRFSTVLQYSTRDLARAMFNTGIRCEILIEPSAESRLSTRSILQALLSLKPHMVIQIDHLRHEHAGLIPNCIPFVCWAQDDLTNLLSRDAGRAMTRHDFFLTANPIRYTRDFQYPPRQCVWFPKLTQSRTQSPKPAHIPSHSYTYDVSYVSNASDLPSLLIEQYEDKFLDHSVRSLWRHCCNRLLSIYESGQCIHSEYEMSQLLHDSESQLNLHLQVDTQRHQFIALLFHPVNNALYRQQALSWAVQACQNLGLKLSIFGAGWEKNPLFRPYAQGSIPYGDQLRQVTRSSRFNLQIVPYSGFHQRVLDGLIAGGFFLIRRHPQDGLDRQIMQYILRDDLPVENIRNKLHEAVINGTDPTLAQAYQVFHNISGIDIPQILDWHCMLLHEGNSWFPSGLPGADHIEFSSASELTKLLVHYSSNPDQCHDLVETQSKYINQYLTYEAGVERLFHHVHNAYIGIRS